MRLDRWDRRNDEGQKEWNAAYYTGFFLFIREKDTFFRTKGRCLKNSRSYLLVGIDQFGLAGQRIKEKNIGTHFATGRAAAATVAVDKKSAHQWM
jgi:hypothetical protein